MPPNRESPLSPEAYSSDAIERWLHEDVVPACDAMRRDPSRGIASADVFAAIRRHHAERVKEQKE